jgi:hypothetical protein
MLSKTSQLSHLGIAVNVRNVVHVNGLRLILIYCMFVLVSFCSRLEFSGNPCLRGGDGAVTVASE